MKTKIESVGWYQNDTYIGEDMDDFCWWFTGVDDLMRDFGYWCERTVDITQIVDEMFETGVGSICKESMLDNYLYVLEVEIGKDFEQGEYKLEWRN